MASDPTTLRLRVAEARELNPLVRLFRLRADDGAALPGFEAGAHIRVRVDLGNGQSDWRHYSLIDFAAGGQQAPAEYLIAVRKEATGRGGSRFMHERLREGDSVEIEPPKNDFPLHAGAGRAVLLAGGIGITPLFAMAASLGTAGRSFELHYGAREPGRAAFRERLAEAPFAAHTRFYFDSEGPERRLDLARVLAQPSDGTHVYVCGPTGFIDAVLGAASAAGWPARNVHREYFGAAAGAAQAAVDADGAFQVTLAGSGRVVDVPAGTTIVEALRADGVEVPVSCEQGVCGTCLTRVLSGEPDHRDLYLTDEERAANDQMLPCCSRAKTPMLVLDL